ncbi:unnamed protein product [Rotaria sp. Silwood1]|nr:unnamed protein product [Rotaria sp. Silwood1]
MMMEKITSNQNSISDFESSIISNTSVNNANRSINGKRARKSKDTLKNLQTSHGSKLNTKHDRHNSMSAYESHTSFESTNTKTSKTYASKLTSKEAENFRQRIENEYDDLQRSEINYYYYINDQSAMLRARNVLKQAIDGTFFVRSAEESERTSNIEYYLDFVSHKKIVEVPICCDKEHRTFWFLSDDSLISLVFLLYTECGHGSEVRRVYTGIDVLIRHKQENQFYELQYPIRICLYRSIEPTITTCIPLPDEVRAMSCQTPLILAILSKKYVFVEDLLDNKANINITDTEGCSPLHYACRQVSSRYDAKTILRDLACPDTFGKIRLRVKQCDNRHCFKT